MSIFESWYISVPITTILCLFASFEVANNYYQYLNDKRNLFTAKLKLLNGFVIPVTISIVLVFSGGVKFLIYSTFTLPDIELEHSIRELDSDKYETRFSSAQKIFQITCKPVLYKGQTEDFILYSPTLEDSTTYRRSLDSSKENFNRSSFLRSKIFESIFLLLIQQITLVIAFLLFTPSTNESS